MMEMEATANIIPEDRDANSWCHENNNTSEYDNSF